MTRLRINELPKLYYPTPDELQGAVPLNENLWMREYQGLMLALANTSEGKDLLCIDDHGLPIIGIRKNAVLYDQGGDQLMADFRVGAKWGNVVRYRWQEVKRALDHMNELALQKSIWAGVPAGAATLTVHPDANVETSTVDGYAGHQVDSQTWATIQGGAGNVSNDTLGRTRFAFIQEYGTSAWAALYRSFFLFDTSSLTSSVIISSAVLSVFEETETGSPRNDLSLNAFKLNIFSSAPASDTAIVNGDYNSCGTTNFATDLGWEISSGVYADFTFIAAGLAAVSKTGISKFAGREADFDATNTEPQFNGASSELEVNILFADKTGTSNDPKLVVVYAVPFTPRAIMF